MAVVETEVEIRCEVERLFDFVNDPHQRPLLSPPSVRLELVDVPATFAEGSRLVFEVHAYGQRQRFVHVIEEWERPAGFVERQLEGPFGSMVHHRRVEARESGAGLVERVEFEPPGGLLGFLMTESRIRSMLLDGFEHQYREMRRRLEEDV